MYRVSLEEFEQLVGDSVKKLPEVHRDRLDNVGFFVLPSATEQQLMSGKVGPHQMLLGLYEGVPLPQRNGLAKTFPDKITLFQQPIELTVSSLAELKQQIYKVVWHEVAHYFGLNHERIYAIERNT